MCSLGLPVSALVRIEIELRDHAGHGNGRLIVTKLQFIEHGLHPRMIPAALRELAALGIIQITMHGRGGNAEYRQPNRFLLNYHMRRRRCLRADNQRMEASSKPLRKPRKVAASCPRGQGSATRSHTAAALPKSEIFPGCTKCTRSRVHKVYLKGQISGCTKCTYRARCTKCTHYRYLGWRWGTWRKVSKEPQSCTASGRTLRIADVERAGSD